MAISKRTRFEVLRRDNFTCRYCGARTPDATLHVDHVIPSALGGSDKPDNLVAACKDCNAGKSSTSVSETTVKDVAAHALKWKQAIIESAQLLAIQSKERQEVTDYFEHEWGNRYNAPIGRLPEDWPSTIIQFRNLGLPVELIDEAIDITARKQIAHTKAFKYFAGICWNNVRAIQDLASQKLSDVEDAEWEPCGHCDACQRDETSMCVIGSGTWCDVCDSYYCMYEAAYSEGSIDTYQKFVLHAGVVSNG